MPESSGRMKPILGHHSGRAPPFWVTILAEPRFSFKLLGHPVELWAVHKHRCPSTGCVPSQGLPSERFRLGRPLRTFCDPRLSLQDQGFAIGHVFRKALKGLTSRPVTPAALDVSTRASTHIPNADWMRTNATCTSTAAVSLLLGDVTILSVPGC